MLARSDEIDLLTALYDGLHEAPRWRTFLARLERRTRADYAGLIIGQRDVPIDRATQWFAGRDLRAQAQQLASLAALDPTPYLRLRPGRVYAATEMLDPQDPNHQLFQQAYLEPLGIRFGRFMRINEPGGGNAWLVVTGTSHEFTGADSALLSSLAPHLSIALRTLSELERARFHAAAADDALARAGIGWTAVDRDARALDGGGAQDRPAVGPRTLAALTGGAPPRRLDAALDVIAAPVPDLPLAAMDVPATILLSRRRPTLGPHAADALARMFGLSRSEALLAIRLAQGERLADAGAALGLTIETTRNYSKQLFAKTGTHGQADLVRLVLTSVASLA